MGQQSDDILNSLLEGCQIIGFDWRYVYINEVAAHQGQSTVKQLTGRTMMEMYPGIEKTEMFGLLRRCMEKRTPQIMENEFTFPGGSKGWFELRMEPVPKGVAILSLDITARHRALEQTQRLDALKDKFIEIVSHELQTPLSEVQVSVGILLQENLGKISENQKQFLETINRSIFVAIKRIRDLVTLLNIEQIGLVLSPKAGTLADLVKSVLLEYAHPIQLKKLKMKFLPTARLVPINMDLTMMRTVIEKLIENAIMYTPENGSVTITLDQDGAGQKLEITDTGIGIPDKEQSNIFERFHRASNATLASPDGAGIGLAISKPMVEAHKGKLTFTSHEGKGTTFQLELPLKSGLKEAKSI